MIGILDLRIGNLRSVWNAVYQCGFDPVFLSSPEEIPDCRHLILPGVGSYDTAVSHLDRLGMRQPIQDHVRKGNPLLGICLGMQLLADKSEEGKPSPGLGLVAGTVRRLPESGDGPVPHMGWNNVDYHGKHGVLEGVRDHVDFYFVHSFGMQCENPEHMLGSTRYGTRFASIVSNENVIGFQFHPEKSQANGLRLIENFLPVGALMLKKRIIPVQLLMNDRLVKTTAFGSWRDVGDPVASSRVYNSQSADELVFLNINRESRSIHSLLGLMEKVSEVCFMPLSLGGGIRSVEDAEALIKNGADKVVLNSIAYRKPEVISGIAERFGSQAVVVSVDAAPAGQDFSLFSDCGRQREELSLEAHLGRCIERGAGEILINSLERDGTMKGYDIALISRVVKACRVPVIGCGGAGSFDHMREAFLETGAQALACGSLFNFGDNNPIRAKAFLSNYGLAFKKI